MIICIPELPLRVKNKGTRTGINLIKRCQAHVRIRQQHCLFEVKASLSGEHTRGSAVAGEDDECDWRSIRRRGRAAVSPAQVLSRQAEGTAALELPPKCCTPVAPRAAAEEKSVTGRPLYWRSVCGWPSVPVRRKSGMVRFTDFSWMLPAFAKGAATERVLCEGGSRAGWGYAGSGHTAGNKAVISKAEHRGGRTAFECRLFLPSP